MKTYRRHYCERKHQTYSTLARCIWRRTAWIAGEGPFALLAWCQVLTVSLHESEDAALESKRAIDLSACGGRCTGRHEIIRLARSDPGAGQKFQTHEGPRRLLRAITGPLNRSTSISETSSRFRRFREGPNHA